MATVNSDNNKRGDSSNNEPAGQEAASDVKKTEAETTADVVNTGESKTNTDNSPEGYTEDTPAADENDTLRQIKLSLDHLTSCVTGIADSSAKTTGEIREIHKLYHNEFANRLQSMQEELERYREVERGRIFDGILTELARLYSNNSAMPDDVTDEKLKKRLQFMFQDMLQILENNGVSMQKSSPGDKRNTRHCQVVNRLPTDNPELHDTVVSSKSTGFYVENRSLIKEMVDIYLYSEKAAAQQ